MSKNKKYYWLKLKENFFEDDTISFLEEQENGKEYCLFYLKLCLKSLKDNGILIRTVGNMLIPYNCEKLAEITKTNVDTVRIAIKLFKDIGLIQILDTGAISLNQITELVGSETDKAELMRKKRAHDSVGNIVTPLLPKCYPEIEIEKEIDIDKKIDIEKENKNSNSISNENEFSTLDFNKKYNILKSYFGSRFNLKDEKIFSDFNKITGYINYLDVDVILKAINNALGNKITNTKYIITTLENWKNENKITISDFKKEKKENEEEC